MAGEWTQHEFATLCDITRGASPRPIHDWIAPTGIPWVKISDASSAGSRFITKTRECIRSEGRNKSVAVFPGDLILSNSATPGIPMFLGIEACVHDGWLLLRNFRGLDKAFAYYLLLTERDALISQGNGSVFTNLKTEILKRHVVRLPPLPEQKRIAHVLGTLDDKIELNRWMNATLESMSRAIFKSWFVDFDPVRQKAAGKQPVGMDAQTAALFPDSFEDSEIGEVPKGWRIEQLSTVMTFEGGTQPPASEFVSEPRKGYVRLVQIRDFQSDRHITFVPETPKLRTFSEDDVMLARYGSSGNADKADDSLARVCRGLSGAYNVALVKVVPLRDCREFLAVFLKSVEFQQKIKGMGARSVQSGFRKEDLDVIPVISAPPAVHAAFEGLAAAIWRHTLARRREGERLATLRDTLLPKLLSGEVRVPEAEGMVEEAIG